MAKAEILIEVPNLENEFQEDDLLAYAEQIGIDIENEKHLMWIAEKGLTACVPEPWIILSDKRNRIFYSNVLTGEKSWVHPLDQVYADLVIKERQRSLNSSFSSGYESKLSSLSDAPPLLTSGKNTPPTFKTSSPAPEKKRDLGHFENRRGTKLAPVKLGTLKMPVAQKSASPTMSFMPKGSSLSRNIRRMSGEDSDLGRSQFSAKPQITLPPDDLNKSDYSDDGSKYSYEETEDDMERSYDEMNPSDIGSQFSPRHSANNSPEALDINSLVQLGTKLPPRLESSKKNPHLESLKEDQPPSLSLRKSTQSPFLKPLQQQPKKKTGLKSGKPKKLSSLSSKYDQYATDEEVDSRIAALNEEQRLRFETIQNEWAAMQEELLKDEKAKYDKMLAESNKKLEEEQLFLRKENSEKISKVKSELEKNIEHEKSSCQVTLDDIKKTNEQKYAEEEQQHKKKLESLNEITKKEINKIELENSETIKNRKEQLDKDLEIEIEKLTSLQKTTLEELKESHATEMAMIENAHREKLKALQDTFSKEENEVNQKLEGSANAPTQDTGDTFKKLQEEHETLSRELNNLQKKIAEERENLLKLEEKTSAAQVSYEEVQEEIDRTENDLDLLRTEKSTLISELSILKENIKNDKSNLLKERNMDVPTSKKPDTQNRAVNTSVPYSVVTQAIQTHFELRDISCQVSEIKIPFDEKFTQTYDLKTIASDFSCQVDLIQRATADKVHDHATYIKDDLDKNEGLKSIDSENLDVFVRKVLERAMVDVSDKLETRFKSIEEKLGSLDNKKLPAPDTFINNIPPMNNPHSFPCEQNQQRHATIPSTFTTSQLGRNRCNCVKGDPSSCEVMDDVKSSIFRLNDILSTSFAPSIGNTVISGFSYPANSYSSPLESFYTQFRQLQEKHRVTELKHKLESGAWKERANNTNQLRNVISSSEAFNFNRALNSSSFTGVPDDPLSRARNLVLREQARSWKQQQQFLSASDQQEFLPLERNRNISISDASPSLASSGFGTQSPMPFLKFEPDPETEYDEWMTRIKTLQDKIRSHKIL
ncbi:hypothetical protein JTE90_001407 [Oedothorax gibbosus]|uniref:WW domain-containing protein n=1 Tax=Oedothorax gibbosus TaxID=931172 RepID=A0AAV6VI72_9ARAC|nr:hypothetical protein JTE90_001407 [Oedothorax gibbosus]